jgi:hypothetical protein
VTIAIFISDAAADADAVEDVELDPVLEHATNDVAITPASNAETNFFIMNLSSLAQNFFRLLHFKESYNGLQFKP